MTNSDEAHIDLASRVGDRLDAYLALLRSEGMRIDPVQHRLVLRIFAEWLAQPESTPERLAGWVVPILASSAKEQATARQRFFEMFAPDTPADYGNAPDTQAARDTTNLNRRVAAQPRFLALLIALFIAATAPIAIWLYASIDPAPEPRPEPTPPLTAARPQVTDALVEFITNYEIEELKLPEQSWSNRSWRWYYSEYDWRKWLAIVLPLAAYLGSMALLFWLILAQLRRRRLKENMRQHALQFTTDPPRMGDRSQISLLQPLRRATEGPLLELATQPTIDATIAAGGLLSPRYRSRTYATDFVALIDQRSRNDHLSAYAEAFIGVLEAAGLGVERFYFRGTPLVCTSVRSRQSSDLARLIATHEGAVVLLFIEELAMADPITGRARDWVERTRDAAARFVVLPVARLSGQDGAFAHACGFLPLECGPAGLRRLVGDLLRENTPRRTTAAEPDRHRDLTWIVEQITLRADRWTQATTPDTDDIQATLDDLALAVGRNHLRWIAGTAIYPELKWSISTHLKRLSMRDAGQSGPVFDDTLVTVSRLPWYRLGVMPDWVRNALVMRLRKSEQVGLRRRILRALGLAPRPAGAADRLEIETRNRAPHERPPLHAADSILLDFLMPRLPSNNPLFVLPEVLARRLMRRPILVLITAGLGGAAGASAMSYAALSEIPINECDLWASSSFDPDRMGPPRHAEIVRKGGNHQKLLATCRKAAEDYPDRLRYKFALYYIDLAIHGPRQAQKNMLESLAAFDYPPALNAIGYDYLNAILVGQDYAKAFDYFQRALELGSDRALGNIFNVVTYSPDAAISNYNNFIKYKYKLINSQSVTLDQIWPAYLNGVVLADGYEIPKNEELYRKYVELDAERGHWEGMEELGILYNEGRAGVDHDPAMAKFYLEKSFAISASDQAADVLATIYNSGDNPDPKRALYMTIFAAKFGDQDAIERVQNMLFKDEIETNDASTERVISGWKALLKGEDREAMFILGEEMLKATSAGSRFRTLALELLARSAKLGQEDASQYEHLWITDAELRELIAGTDKERMYSLGDRIHMDSSEQSDRQQFALNLLRRAAELGHPDANEEYGHLWISDAELQELIAGTDKEQMYIVGKKVFRDSPLGSDREAFGLKLIKRAAELGHPYAQDEL